ncbi:MULTISPECIES: phosphate ABC transporter substrate-binding protein PstS [Curtobacterium]|uniref:phosphate ABC transporter substrate-binding protein PstS n=1 Tax=Curtobacterium TaxID=2034 RepID=UPI0008DDC6BF|nr:MULTISPECIES: phosphate ABC transporter substrate-binding protein PstS [Curtobacterium]MBO9043099.1 phosphate ABC transporter substrate-binding protein PstS [Curtobacterium flaccumfaciens pv. flaccumfaciens]MBT1584033.1 phosphate ABC transporter substrate-binding protein PstS [Curtobacterium flaccumfaciens pv. flaccumfaciens]MCS5492806.1 phosphate ABC transporter substrate-binding protein PstS [Curtobacterium flaccumfaciens pv. flaccumfaciens]MCS5524355.1 phosphate ABC transporter substrate-
MNIKRIGSIAAIAIAGAVVLSSCAANEDAGSTESSSTSGSDYSKLSGTLTGSGSSAQQTAQATWAAGFQNEASGVTVNYTPDGSGAGRENFMSGAADFAGSDAALKDEELSGKFESCKADTKGIDIPVYISPIAIAYKVDGVSDLTLDAKAIAGIFSGKITKWNDSEIAGLNKDAKLPDANITVVHRSDDSGTTQNFSEYVSANASDVWTEEPSQTFPYSVGDSAKGTSGVASAMGNATNAITYIDDSGAGDLDRAKLMVGDKATEISADGAAQVVADSKIATGREDNDLAIDIDRKDTADGAWPLVLVSYAIACQEYKDADKAELVKGYLDYVVSSAAQDAAAKEAKSAALSSDLASKAKDAVASIK